MMLSRRCLLSLGGGAIATLILPARSLRAGTAIEITMRGSPRGERVWFSPQGLAISPGTRIRFVNDDAGNSHTTTAYHPDLFDRHLRIPAGAKPWDSDYLLPGKTFEVTLSAPGVYDYYCLPHELAGMVGRIVVGQPSDPGWGKVAADTGDLAPEVLAAFPSVDRILAETSVEAPNAA